MKKSTNKKTCSIDSFIAPAKRPDVLGLDESDVCECGWSLDDHPPLRTFGALTARSKGPDPFTRGPLGGWKAMSFGTPWLDTERPRIR